MPGGPSIHTWLTLAAAPARVLVVPLAGAREGDLKSHLEDS